MSITGATAPPEWCADALCAQTDPEAFFPEKGGSTAAAKRVCASCPARELCLDYAVERNERFGIWGGKSERERRQIRAERGLLATCGRCGDNFDPDETGYNAYCGDVCQAVARAEQLAESQRNRAAA